MPRLISAFGLAVLILFSDNCWAEDGLANKVDDFVRDEMQSQHIPGVSLLVNKDGKIVLAKGYGLANVEHQVPVKPETVFQSGSVGKQFTATAVMMLVEDGEISLNAKISKYLPSAAQSWANI